jgi:hypothetical protein
MPTANNQDAMTRNILENRVQNSPTGKQFFYCRIVDRFLNLV